MYVDCLSDIRDQYMTSLEGSTGETSLNVESLGAKCLHCLGDQ